MGMGRTCAADARRRVPDFLPSAVQGGAQVAKRDQTPALRFSGAERDY